MAALAVAIPLAANQFDLSIGYAIGLLHILVIGLQTYSDLPWWLAALVTLAIGALAGALNGVLVTRFGINSFIATLGTGTIMYGMANWYSGGAQILNTHAAPGFAAIASAPLGVPASALYLLAIALVLWVVCEYLPIGRHVYVLGANPRAAELVGISASRYTLLCFVAAGTLAALSAIVLASRLNVGQTSEGPEFLLPAFAAALLGSTSIRPGRVNVWGTIVAVFLLAVAVAGLQQLGAVFFVEPLFNGAILIVAVGLAVAAAKRRERVAAIDAGSRTARSVRAPESVVAEGRSDV
jgi:ribose transport system permease protein